MKKLPAHLPPLPDGAVYLGRGGEFSVPGGRMGGWACSDTPPREWLHQGHAWKGNGISNHYAAPADSEIARLNGCGKPSWESAPEWAEWLAQDSDGEWWWYEGKAKATGGTCSGGYWYCKRGGRCERAESGTPNPNWRDTLERRPGKPFYESADDAENEIRWASGESADFYFGTIKCDATPDLIIPADIAKHADIHSLVALHRDGYRIEWDSNGIRGWKE